MLFQKILLKLKKKGRGLAPILETIFNTEIWYLATGSHLNLSLNATFGQRCFYMTDTITSSRMTVTE